MTREGGFLDRIDGFDADYFGILPREAERMDPQQRLFLEVALEAIEDAGLPRERLQGSRTGVFVASYHSDYAQLQYRDVEDIDARTLMGTMHCILSGRLSHFLDLRGPNISIDTGCSASLVSIHLACQSLRSGESDLAVAGGVSLMVAPELLVSMSKVGFMAPDGRCKTFDASADGFGRGEGCGIVVLKRLSDAVADGDRVLAVVRGSAVNQDGHSTLIAAPSGPAQEALIREALANAQVEPGRIGLMETHGTGTALGDPIELEAIAATIGRADAGGGTCWLGAVKANLGHLEAASGVTGVIKAVLALRHQAIPPQLHFTRLNPHASLEGTRLAVPTRLEPWPEGALPRCAAVSSFGMSGTNAHVILEESPRLPVASPDELPDTVRILPLSAQNPAALRALAESWVAFLSAPDAGAEPDIAYTAAERRTHHDCRLAVVGRTREQWRERLADILRGEAGPGTASGQRRATAAPRLAFVFSGQGPQWHAMGRELLAGEPAFRAVVEECDALLRPLSGWSLLDELAQSEDRSRLARTDVAQPALFALQVALAALWKSWGVRPEAVVGHSVGEIAALHVAGVLALPEAVRVVWHRGRIMQEATGLGRMASVGISPDAAAALLRPYGDRLGLAAINAPGSVVLSGEAGALEEALAVLAGQGVSHRMLPVDYAFHSAQMAPFQERLVGSLGALATSAAQVEFFSTVTGGAAGDLRIDAGYIGRNVREPVRLAGALAAMAHEGFDIFVEIAPHPVLGAAIADTVAAGGHRATVVASLRRGRPERETMLQACAGVYAGGVVPDWAAFQQAPGQVIALPAYPWQRRRHWIRPTPMAEAAPARRVFDGAPADLREWIVDHRVFGHLVLPATAVMASFAAAAGSALGTAQPKLGAFAMERPLFVPDPDDEGSRWQTVATFVGADRIELALEESVAAGEGAEWRRIATATASAGREEVVGVAIDTTTATDPVDADAVYARFAELGIAFGPAFRALHDIRVGPGVAQGGLRLPACLEATADGHRVHPALLDGVLQLALIAGGRAGRRRHSRGGDAAGRRRCRACRAGHAGRAPARPRTRRGFLGPDTGRHGDSRGAGWRTVRDDRGPATRACRCGRVRGGGERRPGGAPVCNRLAPRRRIALGGSGARRRSVAGLRRPGRRRRGARTRAGWSRRTVPPRVCRSAHRKRSGGSGCPRSRRWRRPGPSAFRSRRHRLASASGNRPLVEPRPGTPR
ncbi:MAG: type I polyketide synthase [Betaproteobacteria bacterium]|nr:type I polyketide synthase [Betaproteobacteria bacterium]